MWLGSGGTHLSFQYLGDRGKKLFVSSEFGARLIYTVSSRVARDVTWRKKKKLPCKNFKNPSVVDHTYNFRTWEAEPGGSP